MSHDSGTRSKLLDAIVSPLGFYVLALLIIETFIGSVAILRNPDPILVYIGVGLFLFVIVVVTILVWRKPNHLTFDKTANLEIERMKTELSREISRNADVESQLINALIYRTHHRYIEAISCYEQALRVDTNNEQALVGRAVAKSYAEPSDLIGPIQELEDVLRRFPASGKASYNLACLRCLVGDDRWLADLRNAIFHLPEMRDIARRDKDFEKHWNSQEFLAIVRANA